jgi:sucrose-6-phosphate hydrolase SacC (GH32 family)
VPHRLILSALVALLATSARADEPDILFADFEGETYGDWTATGTAFGGGPAPGTLPGQMAVSGYRGKHLVNSFRGGDRSTGTLASPEFTITRKSITFLIGGGGYAGKTCLNLEVGGKVVRTATGPNTRPGGSERLDPHGWDVSDLRGQTARLRVVDEATGGWGHVNVDHVVFTDKKPPALLRDASRELVAAKRYLRFPVKNGGTMRRVMVLASGRAVREFDIELADAAPDWWAPLDISAWAGKPLTVRVDRLPSDSKALTSLAQSDARTAENVYRERLRPGFHFSPAFGWTNDPNGLVYLDGEYHLFFQHNPYGTKWGNMHWGHAVSRDLVHWRERGEALYPDALGPMFSGSAVVDRGNTSGFGKANRPPLVLAYTAAGTPTVQCLAYSTDDGRSFTKYAKNPVVKQITPGNRDPKILWHAPTKRWVMVLYVEKNKKHTIHFLTSPNLKDWQVTDVVDGFFECPDLFELPVEGDAKARHWVLTAADSGYRLGDFDGRTFTPRTPKLPGHRGKGFYAAQTFSDIPATDGRRVQVGWFQAPAPGMPFNQAMTVPLVLKLLPTPYGPRLAWSPVRELEALRTKSHHAGPLTLKPGGEPLKNAGGELLDVRAEFTPGDATTTTFTVRGVPIVYDAKKQELSVAGHRAPAPLRDGKQRLAILVDRTGVEVFASDGLTYIPLPVIPKAADRAVTVRATGGAVRFDTLDVHELRSIWDAAGD